MRGSSFEQPQQGQGPQIVESVGNEIEIVSWAGLCRARGFRREWEARQHSSQPCRSRHSSSAFNLRRSSLPTSSSAHIGRASPSFSRYRANTMQSAQMQCRVPSEIESEAFPSNRPRISRRASTFPADAATIRNRSISITNKRPTPFHNGFRHGIDKDTHDRNNRVSRDIGSNDSCCSQDSRNQSYHYRRCNLDRTCHPCSH